MNRNLLAVLFVSTAIVMFGCGGGGNGGGGPSDNGGTDGKSGSKDSAEELETVSSPGENWGTVEGRVVLKGDVPGPEKFRAKDHEGCGLEQGARSVEIQRVETGEDKKLSGAFVWLEGVNKALEGGLPEKNQEIDQKGCRFHPDALLAQKGGTLTLKNSDQTTHNFAWNGSSGITSGDINQDGGASDKPLTFKRVETLTFSCDKHPWMGGMIRVANHHAYALTGKDGSFSFQVPPGDYTLNVRHKSMTNKEPKQVEITVEEGGTVEKEVELGL